MKKQLQTRFSRRQQMDQEDFELYYYEDTVPLGLPAHTHDHVEIYMFLEGRIGMEIEGEVYPLRYGDVVFIPPGVPHRAVIYGEKEVYRRFVLWMSRAQYGRLLDESDDYGYMEKAAGSGRGIIFRHDRISFQMIYAKVFRLLEELNTRQFAGKTMCGLCLRDLVLEINRRVYTQKNERTGAGGANLCESVRLYVEEHLTQEIPLGELADSLYVSKYYLAHTFKDRMGISIHQYVIKKRLQLGRERLRQGEMATKLWEELGFGDYTSFFRNFKKEYGMSPAQYRSEFVKEPRT